MINLVCRNLIKNPRLLIINFKKSSAKSELINVPPAKYTEIHHILNENNWREIDETGKVILFILFRDQNKHI
jgi:hypothetical protein